MTALASPDLGEVGTFYVSTSGDDNSPGTRKLPFATLHRAQEAIRQSRKTSTPVTVLVREGTYYLRSPLTFGPEDSGSKEAPITYAAYPKERVTISGGHRLTCNWIPYKNGIMMASVPANVEFFQLFINGKRQIRARYPNYDPSIPGKSGYVQAAGPIRGDTVNPHADTGDEMTFSTQGPKGIRFDPATFTKKTWANPQEAEIHIFPSELLGKPAMEDQGHRFQRRFDLVRRGRSTNRCQVEPQSRSS